MTDLNPWCGRPDPPGISGWHKLHHPLQTMIAKWDAPAALWWFMSLAPAYDAQPLEPAIVAIHYRYIGKVQAPCEPSERPS